LTYSPPFSIIGRIGHAQCAAGAVRNKAQRKEVQMQYRIALVSKTLLQREMFAITVRQEGKPRLDAQDTRAFEEYKL
jgi:hypothetical protein